MLSFLAGPRAALGVSAAALGLVLLGGAAVAGASAPTPEGADAARGAGVESAPVSERHGEAAKRIKRILDGLVQAGVITAQQRDRILKALEAELADHKTDKPRKPHASAPKDRKAPTHARVQLLRHVLQDAADAIGIAPGQLKQELRGKSLAQVGAQHGVARDSLLQKLIAAETSRIEQAVREGKLTAEQAERAKQRLAEAIAKAVDRVYPAKR